MQIIKNFSLSLEYALLQKRSSLLHKDIEFHVCTLIVCETVAGFIECMGCISLGALIFRSNV